MLLRACKCLWWTDAELDTEMDFDIGYTLQLVVIHINFVSVASVIAVVRMAILVFVVCLTLSEDGANKERSANVVDSCGLVCKNVVIGRFCWL